MEFISRQDVAAPRTEVFAAISDFAGMERRAAARGFDVTRTSPGDVDGVGTAWRMTVDVAGRAWRVDAEVAEHAPPAGFAIHGTTEGIALDLGIDLAELPEARTRMVLRLTLTPQSLTTRMLLKSMTVMRGTVQQKIDARVAEFARRIEAGQDSMA